MAHIIRCAITSFMITACFIQCAAAQPPAPAVAAANTAQGSSTDDASDSAPEENLGTQPLVTVMVTNAEEVLADIKFLLGEGKEEEKAYNNFTPIFDVFTKGCDRTKPFGLAIYLDDSHLHPIVMVPVEDSKGFFANIDELDIISTPEAGGFYQISGGIVQGSARLVDDYVFFAESKELLLKHRPVPGELFAEFVNKNYDVAALINGAYATTEDRRKAFAEFRKETTAGLKKQKDESELNFNIRKAIVEFQFDEIERFFAESKRIELGWTTDVQAKQGRVYIELEAEPETSLAQTIDVLKRTDGEALESMPKDFVSFGSSHFLFDELRQNHLMAISKLLREKARLRIDEDASIKAADKENARKVAKLLFDLVDANTQEGTLIGWSRVRKDDDGKHTFLAQTTIVDADEVTAMLQDSGVATMNMVEIADKAAIHKVPLYGDYSGLKGQFGDELAVYFATGKNDLKNRLWIGMGNRAIPEITAAVEANQPASEVAAQFRVKVGSWVDAFVDDSKKKPEEKPKSRRRSRRGKRTKARKKATIDYARIAWQTLGSADDDVLSFSLEKVAKDRVILREQLDTGLLRFIGQILTKEINSNL